MRACARGQEVAQHLAHEHRIGPDRGQLPDPPLQAPPLHVGLEATEHLAHHRPQVHARLAQLGAAHPGELEQIIDERAAIARGGGDRLEVAP